MKFKTEGARETGLFCYPLLIKLLNKINKKAQLLTIKAFTLVFQKPG